MWGICIIKVLKAIFYSMRTLIWFLILFLVALGASYCSLLGWRGFPCFLTLFFAFLFSFQVCAASSDQFWGYIWAEHSKLPHRVYPESWLWASQWPDEAGWMFWFWDQSAQVPCHGTRPGEGTHTYSICTHTHIYTIYCVNVNIYIFLFHFPGCIAVVGHRSVPRPVAHAPELSSVSEVAEGAGESSRENHKTSPRLPPVAHHRPHQRLPHRHPAEIPQGYSPLLCDLMLKLQSLMFWYLILYFSSDHDQKCGCIKKKFHLGILLQLVY